MRVPNRPIQALRAGLFLAALALPSSVMAQAGRRQTPDDVQRLHQAVRDGDLTALRSSLRQGVDPDARDASGRTALIEAAERGRTEAAQALIEAGADLDRSQRGWGTPLETAERMGHNALVALLRQAGARSSGRSVGDTVCVRPWKGDGYCGVVEAVDRVRFRVRVTEVVGCADGCEARAECSEGRPVGGATGVQVGDVVTTVSWCLTHTGVKP